MRSPVRVLIITALAFTPLVSMTTDANASGFNRANAAIYADNWSANGGTKLRNADYFSFSDDCTNFTSQAWHAGGEPMSLNPPYWYSLKNSGQGWSNSWSVVTSFKTYWVTSVHLATVRSEDLTQHTNHALEGDQIMYDWGTGEGWSHLSLEIGWSASNFTYHDWVSGRSFTVYGDYMDQHTTDRKHAPWNLGYLLQRDPTVRSKMKAVTLHFSGPVA